MKYYQYKDNYLIIGSVCYLSYVGEWYVNTSDNLDNMCAQLEKSRRWREIASIEIPKEILDKLPDDEKIALL